MSSRGLLVRMHAKHGKDRAVEDLLHSALPLVRDEPETTAWFAVRFGRGEYGIFDVFENEAAREVHLRGPVAAELQRRAGELFETAPQVQKVEVLADKLPIVSTETDTKGLLLSFKAKPGHAMELEKFLLEAKELVENERRTTAWFAIRNEAGEYGIFDVFPRNEDRFMHLVGQVPRELARNAFTLLGSMPEIEMVSVHAEKIGPDTHVAVTH
jgi:quinol monooxygenase YgiN